jgi:hypothetical protein
MNEDYSGVIRRKMEGVYSASAGQERGVDKERKEKDQREASVVS